MKKSKLKKVSHSVKLFLIVFSVISVLFMVLLPLITRLLNIHFDLFISMIYPCAFSILYIVVLFIRMFDSLELNNPFILDNVKRLKDSMVMCFIVSVLVLISIGFSCLYVYYSTQLKVALLLVSILFFGVGIALYILSELFKQATRYKEENDLTI